MDATHSGIIINNSNSIVLSIEVAITFAIVFVIGGGLLGILIAIAGKIGDGLIKEHFQKRAQEREDKKQAAEDIISYCVEGMHKQFRHKAGSEQTIKFRAKQIEQIDETVGRKLIEYLTAWSEYRTTLKYVPGQEQNSRENRKLFNKAQHLAESLIEDVKYWK